VEWAATNELKMILVGGRDAWRLAAWLGEENIPVIYTHTFTLPQDDSMAYDTQFRAPSFLAERGVKVAFSTGDASLVKNIPYEAAQAIAYGMFEENALRGITLYPALLAGVADRLGSIESGKEATLFTTDGSVFDIRSNVLRMWIAGEEVPLDSRHTRLYEKYRARPNTAR
jgi:imidazolonepropionase-like amidohydrolase